MSADTKILKALALLSEAMDYYGDKIGEIEDEILRTKARKDLTEDQKAELLKLYENNKSRTIDLVESIHFAILLIMKAYFNYWKSNFEAAPEILGLCKGDEK